MKKGKNLRTQIWGGKDRVLGAETIDAKKAFLEYKGQSVFRYIPS
jgi:hypothetical protein